MNSLLALGAVILWASLALTSAKLAHLPPFYVMGWAFLIGGLPVLVKFKKAFPPWRVLLLGVGGYYGYHYLLFTALRIAPPVEANLINYLWPMLMVLMAPLFFPEARLKFGHFLGAFLAFSGSVLLVGGEGVAPSSEATMGYLCAIGAAFTWPTYSLLKKKLPEAPVVTTAGICLITGILCVLTHMAFENAVVINHDDTPLLIWLGLGPFGAAFYLWDVAVRRGDPRVVGAMSYLTPVLSTLALVFFTNLHPPLSTWIGLVLIFFGAILGSWASRKT